MRIIITQKKSVVCIYNRIELPANLLILAPLIRDPTIVVILFKFNTAIEN